MRPLSNVVWSTCNSDGQVRLLHIEVQVEVSLFLFVPRAGVWEYDWSRCLDLGERTSERAGGPNGARGPGSGIGSGLTCFVM